jgi:hypothetical protein
LTLKTLNRVTGSIADATEAMIRTLHDNIDGAKIMVQPKHRKGARP